MSKSFNLFLDADVPEPVAPLALSKLLASAFTIHGTHFTVLKQLHPSDAHDFHSSSIDYIAAKVGRYIKQERANKAKDVKARLAAKRSQALTFFKCLLPLLSPVNGRDALKLKHHLSESMESTGAPMETLANGKVKAGEGYRAYEKRLVLIASKDENVKNASQRVVSGQAKDKAAATAGASKGKRKVRADQEEEENAEEEEDRERTQSASPSPAPAARPSKTASSNGAATASSSTGNGKGLARGGSISLQEPVDNDDDQEEEERDENPPQDDIDMDADLDLDAEGADLQLDNEQDEDAFNLDLDGDEDFNMADFPVSQFAGSSQGSRSGSERARSVSVDPTAKRRRGNLEF